MEETRQATPALDLPAAPIGGARRIPVFLAICLYASMAIAAVIWIRFDGRTSLTRLYAGGSIAVSIAVGVGTGLALAGLGVLLSKSFAPYRDLESEFAKICADQRRWEIVLLGLMAGAGEELVFRGAVQAMSGVWVAAAIFGAVHFPLTRRMTLWPLLAFVCGALFGWELIWLDNILAATIAHAVVTGTALWRISSRYGDGKLAHA